MTYNMDKKLVLGQAVSFVVQLVQYERQKNVFAEMDEKYQKMYLIGGLISTVAVVASYLSSTE